MKKEFQGTSQKTSAWTVSSGLVLADLLGLFAGFGLGVLGLLWYGDYFNNPQGFAIWASETGEPQFWVFSFFALLVVVNFWFVGLYSKRFPFWDELLHILRILTYVALSHGVVIIVARWPFSRFVWVVGWLAAMLFVPLFRAAAKSLLRAAGWWQKPTVILGAGTNAREAARALQSEKATGYEVAGFIDLGNGIEQHAPVQKATPEEVLPLLKSLNNPHLVVAFGRDEMQQHNSLLQKLTLKYPSFSLIPDISGLPLLGMDVSHFFSHEVLLLNVRNNLGQPLSSAIKRFLDLIASSILLVLCAPLFAYIAWNIRKTKGPVIFGHQRIGRHGKKFACYKFRSMVHNANEVLQELLAKDPAARAEWEKEFKLKDDPRITKIGNFLRRSSLDELPQLWNVFRGEMSLVGPRPVTEAELPKYGDKLDFYLAARPGITGLWQVSGRSDLSYDERTDLDAWYVKNWNVWYDIAILFKTLQVVVGKRGAY